MKRLVEFFLLLFMSHLTLGSFYCDDDLPDCATLATERYCNTTYMHKYCAKSCNFSPIVPDYTKFKVNICTREWSDFKRSSVFSHQCRCSLAHKYLPAFTKYGYRKVSFPAKAFEKVLEFYHYTMRLNSKREECNWVLNNCIGKRRTYVAPIFNNISQLIANILKPMLEKWTNTELSLVSTFGPRRYLRGSTVDTHVDKPDNRVIGAILNVGQGVQEDWILRIVDNIGIVRNLSMKPGDTVFYESAKVPHGRPSPLKGDFYDNILAHFVPKHWNYEYTKTHNVQDIYKDYKITKLRPSAKGFDFCSVPIS